ncbi:hypothetical protein AeMF1_019174 [Aphanomyces euteiches]|nr:hypothetical protein AeMF1_019174 [Aphanomyces euteiches]KAH9168026.1 hypothetical protein AeNC1_018010 [Aphanomyces euteiches]KAH9183457.1 hypothetical protein AeNC1_014566 [Aphanomyces euteiches]
MSNKSNESVKAASDHMSEQEPFNSTSIVPPLSKQRQEEQVDVNVDQTQVAQTMTDFDAKIEQNKLCKRQQRSKSDSKYSCTRCARQLNSANTLEQGIFPNLRERSRRRSLKGQTKSEEKTKESRHGSSPCMMAQIQPSDDETFFPSACAKWKQSLRGSLRSTMGRKRIGSRETPQCARSFIEQQSIPTVPNPPQLHKPHETSLPLAQTGSNINVAMEPLNSYGSYLD